MVLKQKILFISLILLVFFLPSMTIINAQVPNLPPADDDRGLEFEIDPTPTPTATPTNEPSPTPTTAPTSPPTNDPNPTQPPSSPNPTPTPTTAALPAAGNTTPTLFLFIIGITLLSTPLALRFKKEN